MPILPGHVLVVPYRRVARLTDLSSSEITDLFVTVQRVQKMLARKYFTPSPENAGAKALPDDGSFNIAIQDGKEAGQTIPHVHCHIIPRLQGDVTGDEIYQKLQDEEGNVGGGFWDAQRGGEMGEQRPVQEGRFPKIEDATRKPRSKHEMYSEADEYRDLMERVE
jgi:diadenosine tetraphosphate (Ap4A) HIT family hydrolase